MEKLERKVMDAAREKVYATLAQVLPTGVRIKAGYAVQMDGVDVVITPVAKQTALDYDFEINEYQEAVARREEQAAERARKAQEKQEEKERKQAEKAAKKAEKDAE